MKLKALYRRFLKSRDIDVRLVRLSLGMEAKGWHLFNRVLKREDFRYSMEVRRYLKNYRKVGEMVQRRRKWINKKDCCLV